MVGEQARNEAFENIPDEHRYSLELHEALVKIAGLDVIPFDQQYEYDYDGPYGWTADPLVNTGGHYDESRLEREYGIGFKMLPAKGQAKGPCLAVRGCGFSGTKEIAARHPDHARHRCQNDSATNRPLGGRTAICANQIDACTVHCTAICDICADHCTRCTASRAIGITEFHVMS